MYSIARDFIPDSPGSIPPDTSANSISGPTLANFLVNWMKRSAVTKESLKLVFCMIFARVYLAKVKNFHVRIMCVV